MYINIKQNSTKGIENKRYKTQKCHLPKSKSNPTITQHKDPNTYNQKFNQRPSQGMPYC